MDVVLEGVRSVRGEVRVPGDKSISHRAVILGSVAGGRSRIGGLSSARDVASSVGAMETLGVRVSLGTAGAVVEGVGIEGFERLGLRGPFAVDCGNSGTTARVLTGLLCGAGIRATLTGDESLSKRPMRRVVEPLASFGADVASAGGFLPVETLGGRLRPFRYALPVSSAQLKSALICAALFVDGTSAVLEREATRDHTERMLRLMGGLIEERRWAASGGPGGAGPESARVALSGDQKAAPSGGPSGGPSGSPSGNEILVTGRRELAPLDIDVPGDVSSAVFLVAAALSCPSSELLVRDVLLNPTRARVLDLLRGMGGDIEVRRTRELPEPSGDITVRSSHLSGAAFEAEDIPLLIDEIPALAALAFFAEGETSVRGAGELRVKESDRIRGTVEMVRAFGGEIEELPDGFVMRGRGAGARPRPAEVSSYGDHRLAMAASILALNAEGRSVIGDARCVDISFPGFFELLAKVTGG